MNAAGTIAVEELSAEEMAAASGGSPIGYAVGYSIGYLFGLIADADPLAPNYYGCTA